MGQFAIIPAGRRLWATGVQGRQFLYNCHVAPWGDRLSRHFEFTFMRLMEGGGVGANYSSKYLAKYRAPRRRLRSTSCATPHTREIGLGQMLAFQATYQECYADNAVSFTVNFPEGKYSVDEAADIIKGWLPELKGTTLMPDGTRAQAPCERITAEEFAEYELTSVEDGTDEDCATGACPVR
ncbi:hypothetical protein ACFZAU_37460 [Streptomyces sp. NPDC008238]